MSLHELLTDLDWWLRDRFEALQKEMDLEVTNEQGRTNIWARLAEIAAVRKKLAELANEHDR